MTYVKKDGCTSIAEVIERNTGMSMAAYLKDDEFPHVEQLKEAAAMIQDYVDVNPNGRVTIVGDYDSDGINATAIMYWMFVKLGIEPVTRLPRRFSEGYGLSETIIDEIPDGLLITVDNGIVAMDAIQKAKIKGLKVIVIDHHLPVDADGKMILPPADIIVDPHIEAHSAFSDYCGAAIAYRLAREVFPDAKLKSLMVLASIATVTDVMPIVGVNRTLVKMGLEAINKGINPPGLNALIEKSGLPAGHLQEEDYGFGIGPMFNAAGRLYDNGAERVLTLLKSKNGDLKAPFRAESLVKINEKRKDAVKDAMAVANVLIGENDRPIVLYYPSFGEGIIGIIAGRLAEEHNCPAIVFTDSHDKDIIKGSGRAGGEVHLKNALDKIRHIIVGYGGHAGAAGLSIQRKNLEEFRAAFAEAVGVLPDVADVKRYDLELHPLLIPEVIEEVKHYAPYGEGNPKPIFHMVIDVSKGTYKPMGDDGSHFMVKMDNVTLMAFGQTQKYERAGQPQRIECIGSLSESWFGGKSSTKFEIYDFNPA